MVRNIIFDMGNVLLRYSPMEITRCVLGDHPRAEEVARAVMGAPEWAELDGGTLTDEQAAAAMVARRPELREEILRVMADWPCGMRPLPGMEDLVADLKKRGFALYLLSNASRRFHGYQGNFPVFSCFDALHISADLRLLKPDPAIYRAVMELHALRPEESLFIDDLSENVSGAEKAGLLGLRFEAEPQLRAALKQMGLL